MNLIVVSAPEQLVFGVMLMVVALTYIAIITPYKIIGIINLALCIGLAIEFSSDRPDTPAVGLIMIAFVALGLFNGYYSVFGRD